jgi:transcriptional regulator GlxA family with amidase domain
VTRRIVVAVFPNLQILDLTGPLEVFSSADRRGGGHQYSLEVVSRDGDELQASCGLRVVPDRALAACRGPIDTLIVVGGVGTPEAVADEALVSWVRRAAGRARRVASVCSGAFVLARAGILDGRSATTHWSVCDQLGDQFPEVAVEADRIFVRDGHVWTSAGVTAGMDLALALVEDDLGADVARDVARWLVLFVQRPGGQAQFSVQLAAQRPERVALRHVEGWIAQHVDEDLSVPVLARQAGMSTRNFSRSFRHELGVTPAVYVERVRLESARRLLESTEHTIERVARACGFRTVETMHRSFQRRLGVTPGEYRRHFAAAAAG